MKKNSINVLSIASIGVAFLVLALRVISLFFFYEDVGYFKNGAILPIISSVLLAAIIVFVLIASIFSIDKKQSIEPTSKLSQYAALLPMCAIIFFVLRIFTTAFDDTVVNKYLIAASAIATGAFFFLMFLSKKTLKTLTFYMGVGALLYVAFCWMLAYFNFFVPINSTGKVFFYLSCVGAILFIFNEMCACYGFVRARFYYFSLFASIIILLVAPISAIIGYFGGAIKGYITLEADIFLIALLVYAVTRLIDAQKSRVVVESEDTETAVEADGEAQESITDDIE